MFEERLVAGWGDMDFNSHMRNTAFLDKSADVRMMFFSKNGFSMDEFVCRKIGRSSANISLSISKRFVCSKNFASLWRSLVWPKMAVASSCATSFGERMKHWQRQSLARGGGSTSPSESWWRRRRACWPL